MSNITIIQVDIGGGDMLSFIWTDLIQGRYKFIVVASTGQGSGDAASLTRSITFSKLIISNQLAIITTCVLSII